MENLYRIFGGVPGLGLIYVQDTVLGTADFGCLDSQMGRLDTLGTMTLGSIVPGMFNQFEK